MVRYRFLVFALAAALLVSAVLNVAFFNRGKFYYLALNETRLDPLGLNEYPTDIDRMNFAIPGKPMVVFFGDSRAAEWSAPPDLARFQFINRGIGAQTSGQVLMRFDYHVKPLSPDVIVVQVGINDLKTIPLFPDRKETIVAACKQNIKGIVDRSLGAGVMVVLTTIFPVGEIPLERRPFWSADVELAVDEVNAYLRSLAAPNVVVFDSYSILANRSDRHEMYKDELHLKASGYEVLNSALSPLLETLAR